jgi:hypothetical protein
VKVPQFVFTPDWRILLGDIDVLKISKERGKTKQKITVSHTNGGARSLLIVKKAKQKKRAVPCNHRLDCIPRKFAPKVPGVTDCLAECIRVSSEINASNTSKSQGVCLTANHDAVTPCLIGVVILDPLSQHYPFLRPAAEACTRPIAQRISLLELVAHFKSERKACTN